MPPKVRLPDALLAEPPVDEPPPSAGGSRLVRVALSLLQVHGQIAREELARDQGRLVRGAVLLALAALLAAMLVGLLQVAGVLLLRARGLSWLVAVLGMAGADLVLGLLFAYLGQRALRQPVMPQTRALVRRTVTALLLP